MSLQLVFAHGQGRDGRGAWPNQLAEFPDAAYLSRPADESLATVQAETEAIRSAARDSVIVAHSFGAIAAARAVAADDGHIRGAVLVEPALYSLARGEDAVERAIARIDPVFDADTSLEQFWRDFVEALTGNAVEGPLDDETLRTAARFQRSRPPWRHEVDAESFVRHPTLVVTGGWNDEYEQIASRLVRGGARHVILTGFAHRPQDHPDFNGVLSEFVETAADRP